VASRDEKKMPAGKMAEPKQRRRKAGEMPHGEMHEPAAEPGQTAKKPKPAAKKKGGGR
jgi:hypothetical protein